MSGNTEVFAVLGRIHVLLRRDLNRITDIEWASVNKAYAMELVRLCGTGTNPDLKPLAARLAELLELNVPARPAAVGAGRNAAPAPMGPVTTAAVAEVTQQVQPQPAAGPRYVRGVR